MNFPRFSIISVFVWLTLSACDDGGKKTVTQPSLSLSTITAGEVLYQADPAGLVSEVTVHVVDDGGAALPGVAVALTSLVEGDTFTPASAVTGADGNAVFSVKGFTMGTSTISAHVSAGSTVDTAVDPAIDPTVDIVFDVNVNLTPMDVQYTWDEGDFTLRLSLQDTSGPIAEADFTLLTNEPNLAFDGSPANFFTTGVSGTLNIHATTSDTRLQTILFQLNGIEGQKEMTFDFYGPRVSGTVYLDQSYPLGFRSARVAAMGLNMTDRVTIDLGAPILAQAASESVCPCPSPAGFELNLPIMPHQAMLNTDAFRQVKYNYFPIVVYDDLNDDYIWNEGEPLLAARLNAGILHYAMPDGDNPVGQLGWKLVDVIADEPEELDWDFFRESLDAWLRRSPVTEIHLTGAEDSGYDTARVAVYVVNAAAMTGYTPSMAWVTSMFDEVRAGTNQVLPIVDVPVSDGTYDATVLAPEFTGTQAQDWEITWTTGNGDTVKGYLVIPFVYSDDNGNGVFDAAETVLGTVQSPFGTTEVIFYITEYPNYELFRDPTRLGLHLGYNRIRVPSVLEIQSHTIDAGAQIFTFNVSLPDQLVDVPFQVVADGSLLSAPPVATGTFSTFSAGNTLSVPSSTCTNCGNTGAGDSFVILAPLDLSGRSYLDWTEMNFTSGQP
ncbi:Ig-like domain-containing protein [Myxococcota bacterium]|nr:Ig-like domain-containing protein [Myxococcota bacterium]